MGRRGRKPQEEAQEADQEQEQKPQEEAQEKIQESPASPVLSGPRKVKITLEEMLKHQEQGKLIGWNPATNEAVIK